MIKTILIVILIGVIATLVMDVGSALLRAASITAGTPPELTGKWIQSAIKGNVFVDDIRTSPGEPVSMGRFLAYHYCIGILLALVFYALVLLFKLEPIAWWLPLVFGLATTVIPAFLMFPGMGFGVLGLKGPAEYLLMRTAILSHLFYGIGLTLAVKWLLK